MLQMLKTCQILPHFYHKLLVNASVDKYKPEKRKGEKNIISSSSCVRIKLKLITISIFNNYLYIFVHTCTLKKKKKIETFRKTILNL